MVVAGFQARRLDSSSDMQFFKTKQAVRTAQRAARAFLLGSSTWETRDDHGRIVPLFRYRPPLLAAQSSLDPISREDWRSIRRELRRRGEVPSGVLGTVSIALLALYIGWIWTTSSRSVLSLFFLATSTLCFSVVMAGVYRATVGFGNNPRPVRRALLLNDRCASCGFKLSGLSQVSDGCTVCPECGAAWRLEGRRV